jgi:hypothetical protein
MKILLLALFFLPGCLCAQVGSTKHVFIITTDGFRWQEVFNGADSAQLHRNGSSFSKSFFGVGSASSRREALLPFIWSVVASRGMILGNRRYHNDVSVRNAFRISYPGYNEILTGYADPVFIPNLRWWNRNKNILDDYGKAMHAPDKAAAFTTWNLFPYILNSPHGSFHLSSGPCTDYEGSPDLGTYCHAMQYIEQYKPDLVFLSFGETDENAHHHLYDRYLCCAHRVDSLIALLWQYLQSDPYYRGETMLILTTDHGRGKGMAWFTHGPWAPASGQAWMALLGPDVPAAGEIKKTSTVYLNQIAATVDELLGRPFAIGRSNSGLPMASLCAKPEPGKKVRPELVYSAVLSR